MTFTSVTERLEVESSLPVLGTVAAGIRTLNFATIRIEVQRTSSPPRPLSKLLAIRILCIIQIQMYIIKN